MTQPETQAGAMPAFPYAGTVECHYGMTLRDYFAGQVLAGAAAGFTGLGQISKEERTAALLQTTGIIYEVADAMIAARTQPQRDGGETT